MNSQFTANNRGVELGLQGRFDEAAEAFRVAILEDSDNGSAYYNLACILRDQGKPDEAIPLFRRSAELDPDNLSARHFISALTGETPETAPKEYVRDLFDQYSEVFDQNLRELEYHTPVLLRQAFQSVLNNDMFFKNGLDMGCGTGLSGSEFRPMVNCMIGVDISPKMIQQARPKQIYDRLRVGDIISFLEHTREKYDLFIAADMFVYIGNLKPLFCRVRDRATKGAYFIFSTETFCQNLCPKKEGYTLRSTGRYAHSREYIYSLAEEYGFVADNQCNALLRKEKGKPVQGDIFILRRGA